jgi:hydroxyacylglutathione hydrolase
MISKQIKSEGLAQNSYFIGSGSTASVIDPRRDIQVYLDLALEHGMRIKYIFETHRNEDYVIGSLELAESTQADIFHGAGLDWKYGSLLKDGQEFRIGKLSLTAILTPGHTNESVSYVLRDLKTGPNPIMIFSGDTLFVGDSGRVDLYGKAEIPRMATKLYESLFNKILPLGDGTILCPAHGSGSVCGINIADRDESTIGIEKLQNPMLQFKSKEEFIEQKTLEQPEKPPYFLKMEQYNKDGPPFPLTPTVPPILTALEFKQEIDKGAIVIDTRLPSAFGGSHIKGSYSIWLEGLTSFPGWLLSYDKPILLVLEDSRQIEQAMKYLSRIGYDLILGFLKEGIEGWINAGNPVENLALLSVHQLQDKLDSGEDFTLLDVRDRQEWKSGHIKESQNIYVGHLEERLLEVPKEKPVVCFCSVGHRAGIAASILLRSGYRDVYNTLGGIAAWHNAGFPVIREQVR